MLADAIVIIIRILVALGFWSDYLLSLRKLRATYPQSRSNCFSIFRLCWVCAASA
jgi:hypothetical protein